jgi:hypothetical protein
MQMRKHGLRAFGLSFLALSAFMAVMAVGAQGAWLQLISGVASTIPDKTEVSVSAHTAGTLLLPAKNLEIECKKVAAETLLLRTAPLGSAEGKLLFTECKAFQIGPKLEAAPKCDPVEPIKAAGLAQLILHTGAGNDGHNYVLFQPHKNAKGEFEPFTTIVFSELCALTETSTVKGELIAECGHLNGSSVFVHLDCQSHLATQLLRQVAGTTLFPLNKLIYGLNTAATIDGIAAAKLASGNSWGGHV